MTEYQFETLEKLFPNGFVCIGVMKNGKIHISYKNNKDSEVLGQIEEVVGEAMEKLEKLQDESKE